MPHFTTWFSTKTFYRQYSLPPPCDGSVDLDLFVTLCTLRYPFIFTVVSIWLVIFFTGYGMYIYERYAISFHSISRGGIHYWWNMQRSAD